MKFAKSAAVAGILLGLTTFAHAQSAPLQKTSCFAITQFRGWKAPNTHTLYIRVNPARYYRLDLVTDCSSLRWPTATLLSEFRGSSSVCAPLDWQLKVSDGPYGFPQACMVKTMTELSPAEAAAIPRKFKP